jgi:hypothetical protein
MQYCIRVFRLDGTFATVTCGLGTTTADLCQIVARKFFLTDTSRYVMVLRRHNLDRVLGAHEHPAFLQKRWLEQAGYTEADNLSDHGREDNSYLFQFMFAEPPSHIGLPLPKVRDLELLYYNINYTFLLITVLFLAYRMQILILMQHVILISSLVIYRLFLNHFSAMQVALSH